MPKGNNGKEKASSKKSAPGTGSAETGTSKEIRRCKFCKSKIDRTKRDELKCWLCGEEDFVVVKQSQKSPVTAGRQSKTRAIKERTDEQGSNSDKESRFDLNATQIELAPLVESVTSELPDDRRSLWQKVKVPVLIIAALVLGISIIKNIPSPKELWNEDDVCITPAPTPGLHEVILFVPPARMVLVPSGTFRMGRDNGDEFERPAHDVHVKAFLMDRYEVTRLEYKACVDLGKCRPPFGWNGNSYPENTGNWPVTGVSWEDAVDFATAMGKRLPSEEEWEFAAGRGKETNYPWGDKWSGQAANINSTSLSDVASYAENFGLFDIVGNAQEWTTGEWKQYPLKQQYLKTDIPAKDLRVIRGGHYANSPDRATITFRNALRVRETAAEEEHYEKTGFRCVRNVELP